MDIVFTQNLVKVSNSVFNFFHQKALVQSSNRSSFNSQKEQKNWNCNMCDSDGASVVAAFAVLLLIVYPLTIYFCYNLCCNKKLAQGVKTTDIRINVVSTIVLFLFVGSVNLSFITGMFLFLFCFALFCFVCYIIHYSLVLFPFFTKP